MKSSVAITPLGCKRSLNSQGVLDFKIELSDKIISCRCVGIWLKLYFLMRCIPGLSLLYKYLLITKV